MDELKHAVRTAQEYLTALIPQAQDGFLEEVEQADDGWLVTLSFTRSAASPFGPLQPERVYKQLRVVDGAVESMKIRELSGA